MVEDFTDRYTNIGISAFNYQYFVVPGSTDKKPYYLNVHAYSCMLITNNVPFRWRLKYNEDVDLNLQFLDSGWCTVLFNALMMDKTSTVAKMKGGNQTELYKGNSYDKKVIKARSLQEVWPQYVDVTLRFGRPHHSVNWRKHFNQQLQRRTDLDWEQIQNTNHNLKLRQIRQIKSKNFKEFINEQK